MTHDTSSDPRLLVAKLACDELQRLMRQKTAARPALQKGRVAELTAAIESAVMTLTYSYQEPAALAASEPARELQAHAEELGRAMAPVQTAKDTPALLAARIRWCLRTLSGLNERLATSGATLASGVDLVALEVRNVTKTGSLWLTRVSDGESGYRVVTNLPGIRPGDVLAAAFLPPREVGGEASEAMFLGADKRPEAPGTRLAEEDVDAREATSILHQELARR
jgi:predicted RNA-binding protein with EMAP domain